jgi:hypothetical protein
LVFIGDGRCDQRCQQALYDTRQVRLALDRDMKRVQRVFIATGECCQLQELSRAHPDLIVVRAAPENGALLAQLPSSGSVYLVDPLTNLVMRYGSQVPAKGLLEDLKRLLKLSQIG